MASTDAQIKANIDEFYLTVAYDVDPEKVEGGLRPSERACQYFMTKLPSMCTYWDKEEHKCTFEKGEGEKDPTYYNGGSCDFLGRASKCSQYTKPEDGETDEGYYCIAPNMFICGLGTKDVDGVFHPIPRNQIESYNEVDGIGKCDGAGLGTGVCGYNDTPDKCPVICSYYRPWRMSFGYLEPQSFESVLKGEPAPQTFEKRLPFIFKVLNLRARLQKCIYWEGAAGQFVIGTDGKIAIDKIPFDECMCDDVVTWDYLEISNEGVWAGGANCIVCNGAKPECPFYTGKWVYVIDDKLQDGNKISAQQLLEIRYWLKWWENQAEYESYFNTLKPNRNDPTTSSIFTFYKWERLGSTVSDALGIGYEIKLLIEDKKDKDSYVKKSESINDDSISFIGTTSPEANIYLINTTTAGKYLNMFDDVSLRNMSVVSIDIAYPGGELKTKEFVLEDNLEVKQVKYQKVGQAIGTKTTGGSDKPQISFPSLVRDISKIYNTDQNKLIKSYKAIAEYVKDVMQHNFDCIASSTSDEGGYFVVGSVPLKYQTTNKMVLVVEVGDGTWVFKTVNVWSQWYGGLIIQNKFENRFGDEASGYDDYLPESFSGESTIKAELNPITGYNSYELKTKLGGVTPLTSKHTDALYEATFDYSYFIKATIIKDKVESGWACLGNTTKVITRISDINLNYLYLWKITSAKMVYGGKKSGIINNVEMRVVYPSTNSSSINSTIAPSDQQRYIEPNMCVLEPKDSSIKVGFRNSEWELHVDYKYTELVNEDPKTINTEKEEVVWPQFGGNIRYTSVGYEIEKNGNKVIISNFKYKTVALLAKFTDEEGRLISVVVSKLCTMVTKCLCRNVDIKYNYGSYAVGFELKPSSGLADHIEGEASLPGSFVHTYSPPCGDHEYYGIGNGFMWYPFSTCDCVDYYRCWAAAASCTAPFGEVVPPKWRNDYRVCGPALYEAFVGEGGGLADCVVSWAYRYSKTEDFPSGSYFSGKAYIRGIVDTVRYAANSWLLPPFGNKGREMSIKFMSQEHHGHLSYTSYPPTVKSEWMPMVIDDQTFFISFNAFDKSSYIDCFSFYNQLNFYLAKQLQERYVVEEDGVSKKRFKFEEVFDIRKLKYCSYPYPVDVDTVVVIFYQFKNENHVWAWREIWKDLERDMNLSFVLLKRPSYNVSIDKIFHQYICHEGTHVIKYVAPTMKKGKMTIYPSIALDGGGPRYFNPLYEENEYGCQRVDWKDVKGGSVEGDGGGIYYKTINNVKWNHDENIIFDSEAVSSIKEAKAVDRWFVYSLKDPENDGYGYNRGLIFNLYRNRLKYMPFSEKEVNIAEKNLLYSVSKSEHKNISGNVWSSAFIITCNVENVTESGVCITKIEITGGHGCFVDGTLFCIPGVEIKIGDDVKSATTVSQLEFSFVEISDEDSDWNQYKLELKLNVTPFRMLVEEARKRKIFIKLYTKDEQSININNIIFFEGTYENGKEIIFVWEQKFIISEGTNFEDYNLNGPSSTLSYDLGLNNAGQYFPAGYGSPHKGVVKARSKMRSIYANEEYGDDVSLSVSIENLMEIEQSAQQKLYEVAYNLDEFGDVFVYQINMPQYLLEFFKKNNIQSNIGHIATFIGERLPWKKHFLYKSYEHVDFWQPEGHKFAWDSGITLQQCFWAAGPSGPYPVGPFYEIHAAKFIHMDTMVTEGGMDRHWSLYVKRLEYKIAAANLTEQLLPVYPGLGPGGAFSPVTVGGR